MHVSEKEWVNVERPCIDLKLHCDICQYDSQVHYYHKADCIKLDKLFVQHYYRTRCQRCHNFIYFSERKKLIIK